MRHGNLGKRFVAALIDSAIMSAAGWIIYLFIALIAGTSVNIAALYTYVAYSGFLYVANAINALVCFLYTILMEGGSWHATLGKKIMGLYIADSAGNGISYGKAVARYFAKIVSSMTLCIGYLMCIWTSDRQCLHDKMCGTYVLGGNANAKSPELIGVTGPMAGLIFRIGENGLTIGRDSISCNVVIPSAQGKVSRVHCFVTYNPISDMFILNDRNSTHGTFLANGTKVTYAQPLALRSGDRFYLATPDNTFEVR